MKKSELVSLLAESCTHQLSLYIKLRHQRGQLLTIVREIHGDIIIVEPVSLDGVEFPRTSFYIEEIDHASLAKVFSNATLYAKLRDLKGNLRTFLSKEQRSEISTQ